MTRTWLTAGLAALLAVAAGAARPSAQNQTLETTAVPLAPGCRDVPQPSGPPVHTCWGADATGAGLATADGALAGLP